jgi:hypothetical protein
MVEEQNSNSEDEKREPIRFSKLLYGFLLLSAAAAVALKCDLPKDVVLPFQPWTIGHPWPEATLFLMALNSLTAGFEKRYKLFLFLGYVLNIGAIISLVMWVAAVLKFRVS